MLDILRSWITGICAAAMLAALVSAFTVKGKLSRAVKLATGLFVTLAALSPFLRAEPEDIRLTSGDYRAGAEEYIAAYEETNSRLTESIIEQDVQAYILAKARELGLDCEVTVECREENGQFAIDGVTVEGEFHRELSRVITEELGVGKEQQTWK